MYCKCCASAISDDAQFCGPWCREQFLKMTGEKSAQNGVSGMHCPYCGSAIREGAQFCASCGRRQIAAQSLRSALDAPKKVGKGNWITRHPILSLFIFLFFLMPFVSRQLSESAKTEPTEADVPKQPPTDRNKFLAPVKCEEAVTAQLKSPSTANFASYSGEQVTDGGNGKYYVRSYVDSQNSFGAQIRTGFTCRVQCTDVDVCQVAELYFDQ